MYPFFHFCKQERKGLAPGIDRLKTRVRSSFKLPTERVPLNENLMSGMMPHADTFLYPTLRNTFDFDLEDQRPEFVYDYPEWPDKPNGLVAFEPEWVSTDSQAPQSLKNTNPMEMTSLTLDEELDVNEYTERRGHREHLVQRDRGDLFFEGRRVPRNKGKDEEIDLGQSFDISHRKNDNNDEHVLDL